jgi:putative membrane protein
MKNGKTTTRRLAYAAFVMCAFTAASCGGNKMDDPKEVAEEQNEERFDERQSEKDAQFLVEAAGINMEEIELGKLAQQKGMLADVKDLGKMMEEEHTAALNDLKTLAESKSITLPGSLSDEAREKYDKLSGKTGREFDKEYCDMMVNGHEKAINKFEKAASDANDGDIRNMANTMLPSLRTHLEHSKMCQEKAKAAK